MLYVRSHDQNGTHPSHHLSPKGPRGDRWQGLCFGVTWRHWGLQPLTVKMDQNESNSVMLRSIYKPNSANMYGLSHSHVAIDYVYIYIYSKKHLGILFGAAGNCLKRMNLKHKCIQSLGPLAFPTEFLKSLTCHTHM